VRVLRFLAAGLATALLDNGIFFVLHRATGIRFLSLAVATAVSVTFNYMVVRRIVFETKVEHTAALPKYLAVHAVGLMARYAILEGIIAGFALGPKHWGIYAAKLAADGVVYSLKYVVQRDYVFTTTRNAAPESALL
jgi:putative flippase GtrA